MQNYNLGQYPAVLPSQLVSNPYILLKSQERRQSMKFQTITKLYYQDLFCSFLLRTYSSRYPSKISINETIKCLIIKEKQSFI